MITLSLHDETHIALRNTYPWRTQIKALAGYPDVRWCAEANAWLLHVALMDKLYFFLGDAIAPASPSFWMACPLPPEPEPVRVRRRTKQEIMAQKKQDAQAAGRFGAAVVKLMHGEAANNANR